MKTVHFHDLFDIQSGADVALCQTQKVKSVISGFHRGQNEVLAFQGCYGELIGS
jgi:hypothetical protein